MDGKTGSISATELYGGMGTANSPVLVDVRKQPAFEASERLIAGALRCPPESLRNWMKGLPNDREIVVYCVHGHEVSQGAAALLSDNGFSARYLEGGFEHWHANALPVRNKHSAPERWITRERPKIDRIACPWLIRRYIHPRAEFIYVPARDVMREAERLDATPYDVDGVEFTHEGERCSFDTILRIYDIHDPALDRLALIVRGADTSRHDLAAQCGGLFAISLGLSANFPVDHDMLKHGMVIYDALYTWCKSLQRETHNWPPKAA